jgi:hypothetical protein
VEETAMDLFNPTEKQKRFLRDHILEEEGTILTLKVVGTSDRGFSVNIRGPFRLAVYKFSKHSETVIDPVWAGPQESESHMHCSWTEVQFAKLSPTSQVVRENIGYEWQISFFGSKSDVENDHKCFWFYLKDKNHKAVQKLNLGEVIFVA